MPGLFDTKDNAIALVASFYNQTEDVLVEDVRKLRSWLKSQPHLPEVPDEKRVQNFVILNKCSIERSKKKIDMYYTIRTIIPELFEEVNPKLGNMQEMMEIAYCVPLRKQTKEMYRVLLFKMRNKDLVDKMEPYNVIKMMYNLQELRLVEDVMFGDVVVFDMDGLTFSYLTKLTPSIISKSLAIYEKVYSIPMKAMYVLNSPPFINTVLAILKTLMKPKLFERIHVCKDDSILRDKLPKEMIPKDYGGEELSLEELQMLLKEKMQHHQSRYDDLDVLRVDESKRPAKLDNDEVLGFHGNFKKLSLD